MRTRQNAKMILNKKYAILAIALALSSNLIANTAVQPVPKGEKWMARHESMVERAKEGGIDLLLLGDSITDYWDKRSPEVYNDTFGDYKTANFGISADRTQHLLWRLQNGIGEGFSPKLVILLIGTNNTGFEKDKTTPRNQPKEVIAGVRAVVSEVRARFPDSPLLLFGLFPRGEPDNPQRDQIQEVNQALRQLANGRSLFFENIGSQFLDTDGNIPDNIMPDKLHPGPEGYRIWAKAIKPYLKRFLE
jgi:lysophospholipase L1-like esterase